MTFSISRNMPFFRNRAPRPLLTPEPKSITLGRLDLDSNSRRFPEPRPPPISDPTLQRRKLILKMNTDRNARKLQKKRVAFTRSTADESDPIVTPFTLPTPPDGDNFPPYTSYFPEYEPILSSKQSAAPPTPDPSPPKLKKKTSFLNKLRLNNSDDFNTPITATPGSGDDWHHHVSYYPEYEPIYPPVSNMDPWPRAHPPTAAEIQARRHSTALGHAVTIHYPDLPKFEAYTGVAADKAKTGWTSGKYGIEGWTGYGWDGEALPDADGLTFGTPMPKGVPIEVEGGMKKGGGGGGKGKKDGEEGEDGEEGGEAEGEEGGEGGEAGEGAAGGGGGEGGGGGGKKNKKNKK